MKHLLLTAALIAASSLCFAPSAAAHGGKYIGPADTVPPGGGGGGGGAGAPGAPPPGAPAPTAPGGGAAQTPGVPPGAPNQPKRPNTGTGLEAGPDLTLWQYWWGFNKASYLQLKAAIHGRAVFTGTDDFYLGAGQLDLARESMAPSRVTIREEIVPALLEVLRTERANDILDGSLIALAKIGDEVGEDGSRPMSAAIKPFLSDSSQQLAETAAIALGILGNDSIEEVELLMHLVANRAPELRAEHGVQLDGTIPTRTRAFAAYGLGLIGARADATLRVRIVDELVSLLDGEGKRLPTRDLPVACVISMGLTPLAFDSAAEAASSATGWKRPEQVTTLADQVAFLMHFFEDSRGNNFLVRAHVPMAVARLLATAPEAEALRTRVAQRFLEATQRRSDAAREIQQSCVQALGVLADCDADALDVEIREALMAVADGGLADQQARFFAMIALAQAAGRPGAGQGDELAGLHALGKSNPRSFLMAKLSKGRSATRTWAALSLAVLERSLADAGRETSDDARDALRASLEQSKSPNEVGAFAIAIGLLRDDGAAGTLRDKLERMGDDEARGHCAVALGMVDDLGSIERMQEIVRKSKYKPDLMRSVAIGLGLLGDKRLVGTLVEVLEQSDSLSGQAAIASALGFIGDRESVEPLIAMLRDETKTNIARGFAAAALGGVADKSALPWNTPIAAGINYRANTTTLTSPSLGTGILDLL